MDANLYVKIEVDVVHPYHFGLKFLVELEVVLLHDTLLFESHDLGMELQYEIESREEWNDVSFTLIVRADHTMSMWLVRSHS